MYFTYNEGMARVRKIQGEHMDPLFGPPPAEVPLPRAPLERVLTQLRFSPILLLQKEDAVSSFQEQIRSAYPVSAPEGSPLQIGPISLQMQGHTVWRFADKRGDAWTWRLSLSVDFLSLETRAYVSRADFVERLRIALEALDRVATNPAYQRLGVRYVDRVQGDCVGDIGKMVKPPMLGVIGDKELQPHVVQSLSQATYRCKEGQLLARWGQLPANASHDPNIMNPVDSKSWILDLDVFSIIPDEAQLDAQGIVSMAHGLAERAYAYFRWSVTKEFLKAYGGQV